MTPKELCARNVSAGLREVLNAVNAADLDRRAAGGDVLKRDIDDATADLLATAAECLERAAERLARKAPKAAEPEPVGATAGPALAAGGDGAKPPKKK